jgi:hypothetical protein
LSVVGLASLYIGRILREVQHRPLYVIRGTVNFEPGVESGVITGDITTTTTTTHDRVEANPELKPHHV